MGDTSSTEVLEADLIYWRRNRIWAGSAAESCFIRESTGGTVKWNRHRMKLQEWRAEFPMMCLRWGNTEAARAIDIMSIVAVYVCARSNCVDVFNDNETRNVIYRHTTSAILQQWSHSCIQHASRASTWPELRDALLVWPMRPGVVVKKIFAWPLIREKCSSSLKLDPAYHEG